MAALSLSDAGWAGTLVCGGLLLVVRLLRDQLRAVEQRENTSPASVLTQRLWRFSPARLRQLGVLLQIQHGASVLLSGAFLGCLTMSASAKLVQRPLTAVAVAALPAFALWLPLGRVMWLTRRARARHEPQRGRAAPPILSTGEEDSCTADRRLPVTVVTGFLGAGKSTLLNRILSEEHGKKLLVIENELGEEAIDHELLLQGGEEEIVVLKNGCLCCTVRQDLRRALRALLPRAAALDGVLIETTGVARPGPVVQTLLWDADLRDRLRLDALITLVDCKHALRLLAPSPRAGGASAGGASAGGASEAEAAAAATASLFSESAEACREQIAFADRLLLNKVAHASAHRARPARCSPHRRPAASPGRPRHRRGAGRRRRRRARHQPHRARLRVLPRGRAPARAARAACLPEQRGPRETAAAEAATLVLALFQRSRAARGCGGALLRAARLPAARPARA